MHCASLWLPFTRLHAATHVRSPAGPIVLTATCSHSLVSPASACLHLACVCPRPSLLPAPFPSPPLQSQYVIQQRNVTHLEAHATGVKEEEIRPAIAFLRRHLGLASPQELEQPAAAAAGAAKGGEPKEGLDPGTAEELAEVQFPSS